jgi:hypothetical protein
MAIGAGPPVPAETSHVGVQKCNNPAFHCCALLAAALEIARVHERLDEWHCSNDHIGNRYPSVHRSCSLANPGFPPIAGPTRVGEDRIA